MALRFVPVLTETPDLAPAPRKNPVGKTTRGKRGGWVAKSGKGKFEHKRIRPPAHFVKGSLKTVPWAFITEPKERAFVLKKIGMTALPAGAKVITGHIKSTVKAGRVKGVRVKYLASGVQAVLLPLGSRSNPRRSMAGSRRSRPRRASRLPSPRHPSRPVPRKNPGRLIILNPADPSDPIAQTAKAMTPANRALLERVVHAASSAEITALRRALVTYRNFHGVWPPSIEKQGAVPGKQSRFFVGLGKADHVGYRINKEYPGSNKNGTPFRHHFSSGQDLVTNEEGKGLAVLDRRGARRGTAVTDWIRG